MSSSATTTVTATATVTTQPEAKLSVIQIAQQSEVRASEEKIAKQLQEFDTLKTSFSRLQLPASLTEEEKSNTELKRQYEEKLKQYQAKLTSVMSEANTISVNLKGSYNKSSTKKPVSGGTSVLVPKSGFEACFHAAYLAKRYIDLQFLLYPKQGNPVKGLIGKFYEQFNKEKVNILKLKQAISTKFPSIDVDTLCSSIDEACQPYVSEEKEVERKETMLSDDSVYATSSTLSSKSSNTSNTANSSKHGGGVRVSHQGITKKDRGQLSTLVKQRTANSQLHTGSNDISTESKLVSTSSSDPQSLPVSTHATLTTDTNPQTSSSASSPTASVSSRTLDQNSSLLVPTLLANHSVDMSSMSKEQINSSQQQQAVTSDSSTQPLLVSTEATSDTTTNPQTSSSASSLTASVRSTTLDQNSSLPVPTLPANNLGNTGSMAQEDVDPTRQQQVVLPLSSHDQSLPVSTDATLVTDTSSQTSSFSASATSTSVVSATTHSQFLLPPNDFLTNSGQQSFMSSSAPDTHTVVQTVVQLDENAGRDRNNSSLTETSNKNAPIDVSTYQNDDGSGQERDLENPDHHDTELKEVNSVRHSSLSTVLRFIDRTIKIVGPYVPVVVALVQQSSRSNPIAPCEQVYRGVNSTSTCDKLAQLPDACPPVDDFSDHVTRYDNQQIWSNNGWSIIYPVGHFAYTVGSTIFSYYVGGYKPDNVDFMAALTDVISIACQVKPVMDANDLVSSTDGSQLLQTFKPNGEFKLSCNAYNPGAQGCLHDMSKVPIKDKWKGCFWFSLGDANSLLVTILSSTSYAPYVPYLLAAVLGTKALGEVIYNRQAIGNNFRSFFGCKPAVVVVHEETEHEMSNVSSAKTSRKNSKVVEDDSKPLRLAPSSTEADSSSSLWARGANDDSSSPVVNDDAAEQRRNSRAGRDENCFTQLCKFISSCF
jgi:hypothetical protein